MNNLFLAFFWLAYLCLTGAESLAGIRNETVYSSLWLSNAAYCPPETYLTHAYTGPSEGFIATHAFSDETTDTQGFIGVIERQKMIFVAFRGSMSIKNWVSDMDSILTLYNSCELCYVHHGFYTAYNTVAAQVREALADLHSRYSNFDVVFTGHSLGGALATLAAVDTLLTKARAASARVFLASFGSPRVGNEFFAKFVAEALPASSIRYTHLSDPVPHLPTRDLGYTHFPAERYEDAAGGLLECDGGEDARCSAQWCYEVNFSDHMKYLGLNIGCKYVTGWTHVPDPY
eukprot:gene28044-33863_t